MSRSVLGPIYEEEEEWPKQAVERALPPPPPIWSILWGWGSPRRRSLLSEVEMLGLLLKGAGQSLVMVLIVLGER